MHRRKKNEKENEDHEVDGYQDPDKKTLIDFAWVVYVGLQIGYTEREVAHMYYSKWVEMFKQFKKHHNMIIKKVGWKEV